MVFEIGGRSCADHWRESGFIDVLSTFLSGRDASLRRAGANVIGSIRFGAGIRPGNWRAFHSRELSLVANYVLDKDPVTASNAVDSFVDLLGGEDWDHWRQLKPLWDRALANAGPPQSRGLAKLYAFTSVPIAGASQGILRLYEAGDPETRSLSFWAINRAEILELVETESAVFSGARSTSVARRMRSFAEVQALAPAFWSSREAPNFAPGKKPLPSNLQSAWERCTWHKMPHGLREIEESHDRILQILDEGLDDDSAPIRLSCAKALIPIGKIVDWQLGLGAKTTAQGDKPFVAELLEKAARKV